jgi:hypothetical protein
MNNKKNEAPILEERGIFWWHGTPIPDENFAPENSESGTLTIQNNGSIELDLDGLLRDNDAPFFPENQEEPIRRMICGVLKGSNQHVLLSKIWNSSVNVSTDGISYERYIALQCLVSRSKFSPNATEPMVRDVHIDLEGLEEWLGHGAIEQEEENGQLVIRCTLQQDKAFLTPSGVLKLEHQIHNSKKYQFHTHDVRVQQLTGWRFIPTSAITTSDAIKEFNSTKDLITLLTNSEYDINWPTITVNDTNQRSTLYFQRSLNKRPPPNWFDCCVTLPQIQEDLGEIYTEWSKKSETYGPGFYLYLATRVGQTLYQEHRFVNLVWGIESLHRRQIPTSPTPSALAEKVTRILDQISNTRDKKWLSAKLAHASEPTLAERINQTFSSLPINIPGDKLKAFSKNCADLRNEISHFGGGRDAGSYSDFLIRIANFSESLSILYHALLLFEIGIDNGLIQHWVKKGRSSHYIRATLARTGIVVD